MIESIDVVLALNVLWFGAAFWQFSLRPQAAANGLVLRPLRDSPLFETIAESLRFLGGLNFAFSMFALLLLLCREWFPVPRQFGLFAAIFALAHGSQFAVNVPVALAGARGAHAPWPVLRGTMLFIFVVDGLLMVANGVLALELLSG